VFNKGRQPAKSFNFKKCFLIHDGKSLKQNFVLGHPVRACKNEPAWSALRLSKEVRELQLSTEGWVT
jgi:hypothetical protein